MDERLTAKQARELSGRTLDEKIDSLLLSIKSYAEKGKRQIRCGYDHKEDIELWINGGYNETDEWKKAKNILEELGYEVLFYYFEGQLVDMYTLIKW